MIDRAGHYELLTRLVAGAQQIELGAAHSPFALNPWDVPDPASVSREKVAFLLSLHTLMMGDEGLGKAEQARARRGDPRRLRARRDARGRARRASRCCATSCWPWPTTTSATAPHELAALVPQPRHAPERVVRRGHLRLPARPPDHGPGRQPAGRLRHPPLPAGRPAARDVLDHGVRHRHRRAPLGRPHGQRAGSGRPRASPAARSC